MPKKRKKVNREGMKLNSMKMRARVQTTRHLTNQSISSRTLLKTLCQERTSLGNKQQSLKTQFRELNTG